LAKDSTKVTYGEKNTQKALDISAVDILLVSDSLDDKVTEKLEEKAAETGATIEILSTETEEGNQLKELGGVGAILRFPIY
ncbi:mRNA surveillance protein Pelota, partial [archaeon]|nr:mRNA surveillance protein Pelota [archaeon]